MQRTSKDAICFWKQACMHVRYAAAHVITAVYHRLLQCCLILASCINAMFVQCHTSVMPLKWLHLVALWWKDKSSAFCNYASSLLRRRHADLQWLLMCSLYQLFTAASSSEEALIEWCTADCGRISFCVNTLGGLESSTILENCITSAWRCPVKILWIQKMIPTSQSILWNF